MNFRTKLIGFFLAITIMAVLSSCNNDDEVIPMPTISGLEVGEHEGGSTAYVGQDLHIEAEILAEGKIDKIKVEIHLEGEHDHEGEDHEGGEDHIDELEMEFTSYAGQKNAEFHEHIEIPANMEAGEYHFHMTVIDQKGNTVSADADFMIEEQE